MQVSDAYIADISITTAINNVSHSLDPDRMNGEGKNGSFEWDLVINTHNKRMRYIVTLQVG